MKEQVLSYFSGDESQQSILSALANDKSVALAGVAGSAAAFYLAALAGNLEKKFFCLFETETRARQFYEDLTELAGADLTAYYPALNGQLWSELGPPKAEVGQRILALSQLKSQQFKYFITSGPALLEKVADPEDVELYKLSLEVGKSYVFEQFIRQLVEMGFTREERVDVPGEMSVRGGIVDLFLFEEENPFRIEFFGDDIESIRIFDNETQRSIEQRTTVEILPLGCAGPYSSIYERTIVDLEFKKTLLDYLDANTVLWIENKSLVTKAMEDYQYQALVHFENKDEEIRPENITHAHFFESQEFLVQRLAGFLSITIAPFAGDDDAAVHIGTLGNAHFGGNLKLFRQEVDANLAQQPAFVALVCDSEAQQTRLKELFEEERFPQDVHISTLNLSEGFSWPRKRLYIYTNRELYSRVRLHKLGKIEKRTVSFQEHLAIKRGDYVVHTEFGIGIFDGLGKIPAYGKMQECLTLIYQDGDKLYVPLEKMGQVQKYSSSEGVVPVLNKLGSPQWELLKKRTKKRMREITEELIKLYATRRVRSGFAFSEDTVWQKELEASFPFEETVDQLGAINDVKKDMQKAQPMDRLICGDVGYGKTEVAVRAAFKALNDGKQVAVLVPTTILAEQHFATFAGRFAQFPVKIDVLSRFKSPKQQKEIIAKLGKGDLDLVVGTHRLLSKDVVFKDIGLLIVDEEQRFGVLHKEKLKLIKQTVDTLTLSATPIPRTMHMALMGAKDMSIINSPPHSRLPIKTEVSRFDRDLVREVILREMDRGGQVFFVHNRVQSIYGISALLNEIVPEAKVAVAHGQMHGHELEKVMLRFIRGEVQVLVSTMIIESGIDMPNANTLIVNRADKLGLAQLYQLRGRVGRSDQQAYAYLLIPPVRKLTHDAVKRLQTIQEYSELGSGYKIAMRDLEIRGAGNVFGAEQTGFVNALGYELYTKIIQETIVEIRHDLKLDEKAYEPQDGFECKVECAVDAYLPEDYVSSQAERVDIYRRLVKAQESLALDDIHREIVDRFGPSPKPVQNLVDYLHIKLLAAKRRLKKVSIGKKSIKGEFDFDSIPQGAEFRPWLGKIVGQAPDTFELEQGDHKLNFMMGLASAANPLGETKKFLQSIG